MQTIPYRTRTMIAALAACALVRPAAADEVADFYKGKTFTIVAGFSPGGGFDLYARALARHVGKHIPGNPNVIVQNQPGAGSLTSVRSLDVLAPKDGTVMTIFNPGLVTQSIVTPDKVKLDFRKYAWIGIVSADYRVCYGFGPNGVKTWDDMMRRKEWVLGSTGKGAGNYINGATLRDVFHAPVKQVLGFPGSAEQRLAIERGELDGDCGSFNSIPVDWVKTGKVHPFVRFVEKKPADIPESAAYIGGFATTDEQKQLLNVLDAADEIGRPFIMSKQVPADRVATVRQAFNETMTDPAFIADMDKMQLPITPLTGEEADAVVERMLTAPPKILAAAKAIYE
jgi:tripartite-type tricarboxylate transporter receptor subunit TctC